MEDQSLTTIELDESERIDDLMRCGLKIIQNSNLFCFGMDAVLLSGFATIREGEHVLDLCSGNGIIPLLLAGKTKAEHITGVEIQPESAQLATRSVGMNGLTGKITIINRDLNELDGIIEPSSMDAVTCNPPYMIDSHGLKNPDSPKAIARHEIKCDFEDIVRVTARVLKPGGRFFLVHRPFRLVELMQTLTDYKLEPKRMKLVYPYIDQEPNMVLIEAVRGGKRRLTVEKPLIVYKDTNVYTDEIYEIYGY